jgi:hypothetical protein
MNTKMFIKRLFNICVYFCVIYTLIGCATTPQGGFRITSGSGNEYYARSISFTGVDGAATVRMRDWSAKEFNILELPYFENGHAMGWGTLFFTSANSEKVSLEDEFRVDVITEDEYVKSLLDMGLKENR